MVVGAAPTSRCTAVAYNDPGMQEAETFHEALKVFIRIQAAKQWTELGGKMLLSEGVSRRRDESDS